MKKKLIMVMTIFLLGGLAACGSSNDDNANKNEKAPKTENQSDKTKNNPDNGKVEQTKNNETADNNATDNTVNNNNTKDNVIAGNDIDTKMQDLDFAEIELSVEYKNDEDYEAEIEKSSTGDYKAELDDDLNNNHLRGQEAFDHLYPIVQKIMVNPDSSKDEIIKNVLGAFDLDNNYTEFDVEFIFHDGKKLEIEDKK